MIIPIARALAAIMAMAASLLIRTSDLEPLNQFAFEAWPM